jgi:hypothetical protein
MSSKKYWNSLKVVKLTLYRLHRKNYLNLNLPGSNLKLCA